MTVQACMLLSPAMTASAIALNSASAANGGGQVNPRLIDNPLANNLGVGSVLGFGYFSAYLLNSPSYATFYDLLKNQPIYVFDSSVLFLPQPEV